VRRMHLFEFADFPWFPRVLRESLTDHLTTVAEVGREAHEPFAARLKDALNACGEHRLVDLCTGGGGAAATIADHICEANERPIELTLTDLYPNLDALSRLCARSGGRVRFVETPVDATRVPPEVEGFRLICNGLHHLRPGQVHDLFEDAVDRSRGIAVFEALDRSPAGLLQTFGLATSVFFLTPLAKPPARASRWLFTYVLPLLPLLVGTDGVLSWLRIYSEDELREIIASLGPKADAYVWEIGRLRLQRGPFETTYLIGYPRDAARRGSSRAH
jgi:hypothetical protein